VRYQLRHAPRLPWECIGVVALFSLITAAFAGIAVWSASAGEWVIAAASAALAAWMGSLAWSALRKTRS
jgi:hypothetical protein